MNQKIILSVVAIGLMQSASPTWAANPPRYPEQGQSAQLQDGTVEIHEVTRSSQGQWYRASLLQPLQLESIEIFVLSQRLKIHEANLITVQGERISVRELRDLRVADTNVTLRSERLNLRERVVAIDIRAESYGGYAAMAITAVSGEGRPHLVLDNLPLPPPPATTPERPGRRERPNRPQRPGNGYGQCASDTRTPQLLERLSDDLALWNTRMSSASYNSTEYNMAKNEMIRLGDKMTILAQSRDMQRVHIADLEKLGAQFIKKMNASSYNSVPYNTYSKVSIAVFGALESALDIALNCEIQTNDELLALAGTYIAKMNSYSYNSVAYKAYKGAMEKLFRLAPNFYQRETLSLGKTFVKIDVDAEKFNTKMNEHSYNSSPYNGFKTLTATAIEISERDIAQRIRFLDANIRFELVRFYDGQRNRHSYNSALYNHYVRMKEISANIR